MMDKGTNAGSTRHVSQGMVSQGKLGTGGPVRARAGSGPMLARGNPVSPVFLPGRARVLVCNGLGGSRGGGGGEVITRELRQLHACLRLHARTQLAP